MQFNAIPALRISRDIARSVLAAAVALGVGCVGAQADDDPYVPKFTEDGALVLPKDGIWREWIYIGAIATPDALNGGEAPFPEFHSVYIDPVSWDHWLETGSFRDGTVLAKELNRVYSADALEDGSTLQVSGRGYFMGEPSGFEIALKSKERFPDEPGYWAYFTFGHHAPPYADTAPVLPAEACNACHEAAAAEDFVFTQFYPVLNISRPAE